MTINRGASEFERANRVATTDLFIAAIERKERNNVFAIFVLFCGQ